MITPDEALRIVLQNVLSPESQPRQLLDAVGLRLAEDIRADRDYPAFNRAMMDGYAVRLADAIAESPISVVGQVAAGQPVVGRLSAGQCVEVMTGAACPDGTEAVVPQEDVVRNGNEVQLFAQLSHQQNMAVRGTECRAGDTVLRRGELITPIAVGVLASVGLNEVRVVVPPKVGIVTTGGELVERTRRPDATQIRDSNGPMLAAMVLGCGLTPAVHTLHARDDVHVIREALDTACDCELVLFTGGVSAGRFDLVPESLRQAGVDILFHKVAQKPGKPLLFGRRGRQLYFGLPGNPLAVHLCFHRYVGPAIRHWCGHAAIVCEGLQGRLLEPVRAERSRTWFVLGRAIRGDLPDREWNLQPLLGSSSADLFRTSQANCYLEILAGDRQLPTGARVAFEWLVPARNAG